MKAVQIFLLMLTLTGCVAKGPAAPMPTVACGMMTDLCQAPEPKKTFFSGVYR